jgi:hypothetical protein
VTHEVSGLCIIYDTLGEQALLKKTQLTAPHKVLITNRNVPGQLHWRLSSFANSPPKKPLINFAEYIKFFLNL